MKRCRDCGRTVDYYLALGRCRNCYNKFSRRQKAYGRWDGGRVDAAPVREHIHRLQAAAMGLRRVEELSGIHRRSLQHIANGHTTRTYAWVARAILAVPMPATTLDHQLGAHLTIDPIGSQRRLQALIADGHTGVELARELGMHHQDISKIVRGERGITVATARRIREGFERLEMTPGTSNAARNRGLRYGWPRPLAWDPEEIDDPKARPSRRKEAA